MSGEFEDPFARLSARVDLLEGRLESETILGHNLDLAQNSLLDLMGKTDGILLPMDASWVLTCATLVFLMQLGFAQLEAGLVQTKNVIATYMKNLIDFVLGALSALFFGYGIAYEEWPLFDQTDAWKFFFHLVFQATASTIVSGAIAGRIRLDAYMALTTFMSGVIFSLAVRWTWGGGWLSQLEYPFQDFAGSSVVHLLGGAAAAVTAYILGERKGRFDPKFEAEYDPHSVPQVLSGVLLLWVGWYGFNPGSTGAMSSISDAHSASNAAMTTTLSASTAACAMLFYNYHTSGYSQIDVLHFGNSLLAGLVAITAGCDTLTALGSMAVGLGGAFVYYNSQRLMQHLQIDDVVAAGPVHGAAGAFGTIAVGFLDPTNGYFYTGKLGLLWTQIVGVVALTALSAIPFGIMGLVMNYYDVLRTSDEEEEMGLDMYVFGLSAYKQDQPMAGMQRLDETGYDSEAQKKSDARLAELERAVKQLLANDASAAATGASPVVPPMDEARHASEPVASAPVAGAAAALATDSGVPNSARGAMRRMFPQAKSSTEAETQLETERRAATKAVKEAYEQGRKAALADADKKYEARLAELEKDMKSPQGSEKGGGVRRLREVYL